MLRTRQLKYVAYVKFIICKQKIKKLAEFENN